MKYGYVKVASAAPEIRVADPEFNASQVIGCIAEAEAKGVKVLVLPELCLTGSTCSDLFYQRVLLLGAEQALRAVVKSTEGKDVLAFVGLPYTLCGKLYSVAAAVRDGQLLALLPRTDTASGRFSAPGRNVEEATVEGLGTVCFSSELLLRSEELPGLTVAAVLGEDVAAMERHCAAGATVIARLTDTPMSVWSKRDAVSDAVTDSRRFRCGIVSAAPGEGESTTDKVYSGLCFTVECGEQLAATELAEGMAVTDLDTEYLLHARRLAGGGESAAPHAVLGFHMDLADTALTRRFSPTPFVPDQGVEEFCTRALDIQVAGIIKRMRYTGLYKPVIGVSGGVDSTLVMLACARALEKLGLPKENLIAVTMPCFGTTDRTKNNAITIAQQLGATLRIIPIGESVKKHFETIGHDFDDHSVVFENAQARERTMCLLDIANKVGGLDVGTKDLSEQADGWTTFNGDQISNYDINAGLTKTMVKTIVRNYAAKCQDKVLAEALLDIDSTPVTPELLPISDEGELIQKSEDSVGPYILQDFFLYHMVMRGGSPEKVLAIAQRTFEGEFDRETLILWIKSYCKRFFTQQYKRSTSADGPAVMGFTLSPRDGFKMPSDAENTLWLGQAHKL